MEEKDVDPQLLEQLRKLQAKYDVMGQDLSSYLDGLLYSDYLTYWDYVHLDTLLSLQSPKTHFPDETVFIIYHQISELYFKLILHEVEQLANHTSLDKDFFLSRLHRIVRYFKNLTHSFEIMVEGLDKEQFLRFRMALLPSSGFQSAQYRLIEFTSTDLINLVEADSREALKNTTDIELLLDKVYWRRGATELASGKKTLTLQQFEEKYWNTFAATAREYQDKNLKRLFESVFPSQHPDRAQAIALMREFDMHANVLWPLAHLKSAARYLHKEPDQIKATGGTNWQKYLPPRFQRIIFFPDLWSDVERAEWGKAALVTG